VVALPFTLGIFAIVGRVATAGLAFTMSLEADALRVGDAQGVTVVEVENPVLNQQSFERGVAQAAAVQRGEMTAAGTYLITGGLLILLAAAAAFGWSQVQIEVIRGSEVALAPRWTWLAFLLSFIVAIVGAFAFRAAPITAPLYALFQGLLLGMSSRFFELEFDGIVVQAVLATVAIFTATWLLYATRIVKVTSRLVTGVAAAMGGLLILYMTAWLLSLFGANLMFLYAPTPLGIALSVAIVILGALNLLVNFDFVERAAAAGGPSYMQWYLAFGLMLAIIWIYVSVLRLLALLRSRRR
jgi:uncharacterized YccA/Bax inhibitor family protein